MKRQLLLFCLAASPLAAQAPKSAARSAKPRPATTLDAAVRRAAATITEADVRRRINIIADDSMRGRDTPSRELDLTAQYLADEYQRLGLKPGGEHGTWFQRYEVSRRRLQPAASSITVTAGSASATTRLDQAARFYQGQVPTSPIEGPAVILGGALTPEAAEAAPVRDRIALLVADYRAPANGQRLTQVIRALRAAGPAALVIVSNRTAEEFAALQKTQTQERPVVDLGGPKRPSLELRDSVLRDVARAKGIDFDAIRASATPVVRADADVMVQIRLQDTVVASATAPNVVAIKEGSDPKLKHEYVVFSAHMDHVGVAGVGMGCTAKGADSICNGADDDASGTVGVVELAEAFVTKGLTTKRSIVFLNVSGEEKGLWGSQYFADHPTVPLKDIVANVNIDMIGRNWPDTIVAIGKDQSDLGATLERVNAAHPELRMTAIDDKWPEERFYFRSDHYNFARKGVPILFFFNGVHPDYHQVSDSPDKIDAEKEARIVQLCFYLGYEIANTIARPQWDPASYKEIVEGPGGR